VLDLVHRLSLERIVLAADGFGALERHVLEHVCDAGFTARIVHRTSVHVGMKRHYRRFMALENDKVQSVREREFRNALFKVF